MGWLGWCLTILGLLIGMASLCNLIGWFMPVGHVARRSMQLNQPPERVWNAIRSGESWPGWWDILESVEKSTTEGQESWRLRYKDGNKFRLVVEEESPAKKLVLRIDDESALFGGTWVYELAPAKDGAATQLKLTENGELYPPFVRFMARCFMNPSTYIDWNLRGLAGKFGETAAFN